MKLDFVWYLSLPGGLANDFLRVLTDGLYAGTRFLVTRNRTAVSHSSLLSTVAPLVVMGTLFISPTFIRYLSLSALPLPVLFSKVVFCLQSSFSRNGARSLFPLLHSYRLGHTLWSRGWSIEIEHLDFRIPREWGLRILTLHSFSNRALILGISHFMCCFVCSKSLFFTNFISLLLLRLF